MSDLIRCILDADSESPAMTYGKMLPWRVIGKKLFWSRDRLVKHKFNVSAFGLGLLLGLWIASGLWLGLGQGFT